jgi:ParB family transcriptional regulator, chromosome partitioning protein
MKKNLGRGLSYLIGGASIDPNDSIYQEKIIYIPITQIIANPDQPRKNFNEDHLKELALSIEKNGIISPIIVKSKGNSYEIIAGERRFRAAQLSKLDKNPINNQKHLRY